MSFSFPTTSVDPTFVSSPSVATQTSPVLLSFDDDGRNSQFSSSFSIRAILSSSSSSPPAALRYPSSISYPQLLLAGDAGLANHSPFPQHHCCQHGACAVNWQTDTGAPSHLEKYNCLNYSSLSFVICLNLP